MDTSSENEHEKTRLRKVNLNRETESFLIAAEHDSVRTNYFKAKIDNTLQNN